MSNYQEIATTPSTFIKQIIIFIRHSPFQMPSIVKKKKVLQRTACNFSKTYFHLLGRGKRDVFKQELNPLGSKILETFLDNLHFSAT